MKFRYYITDTFNGSIVGTNSEDKANELAECEEYFVLDTITGLWITIDGPVEINELSNGSEE